MDRHAGWQAIRWFGFVATLSAAMGVAAADYASVQTSAQVRPFLGSVQALPGCGANLQRGNVFESSGVLSCAATVGSASATFEVFGEASGPTASGKFGSVKTRAGIQYTESVTTPILSNLTAISGAWFTDRVSYDANLTHRMTFTFELDGSLELVAHPGITTDPTSKAMVDVVVSAYSAHPNAYGDSTFRSVRNLNGTTSSSFTASPVNSPDFGFGQTAPGKFILSLGPSFFGPAFAGQLPSLELMFRIFSTATIETRAVFDPVAAHALSDFSNTFAMTEMHIFDAAGNDVTTAAFLGFGSVAQVPEPGVAILFGIGLLAVVLRSRLRSDPTPCRHG